MELEVGDITQTRLNGVLRKAGYTNIEPTRIHNTLQGSIWKITDAKSKKEIVVKVANRRLFSKRAVVVGNEIVHSRENILKEAKILSYLSSDPRCPPSIVKYADCFQCSEYIYLLQQFGGFGLFDFVVKAHRLLSIGHFEMEEWHKMVKLIFGQIIEGVEFMHKRGVCHFDLSLENMLISDVDVVKNKKTGKLSFRHETVQCVIVDCGLAEMFDVRNSDYQSNKHCGKLNYQSPEVTAKKSSFNAKANDVFALGVVLFMMIIGSAPFCETTPSDPAFNAIMKGDLKHLLSGWQRMDYVNQDLMDLFLSIFQYEDARINLDGVKNCKWLNSK